MVVEEIRHLRGEDSERDTGGESHNNRIGNELYHRAELEETHKQQYTSRHECRYGKTGNAV